MILSQTCEYALRAVVWLAGSPGAPLTAGEIARATHVPSSYLSKVLGALRRAGLVTGQRGLRGGFVLAVPPERLTVLEVVNAVDPIQRIDTCPLNLPSHEANLCPLHRMLDDAQAALQRTLGGATISDLLASPDSSHPLCRGAPPRE